MVLAAAVFSVIVVPSPDELVRESPNVSVFLFGLGRAQATIVEAWAVIPQSSDDFVRAVASARDHASGAVVRAMRQEERCLAGLVQLAGVLQLTRSFKKRDHEKDRHLRTTGWRIRRL